MGELRNNLFSIVLFICISVMFGTVANASSAGLLEATADGKLRKLMGCIKSNDNDISLCLDSFKDYLRTEIQLVKAAPDKEKYNKRLNKMVEYLRKSADIYYQKAQSTRSLKYYEKASRCANLLVKLSGKYKNYGEMIREFENVKRGSDATVLLEILYRETTKKQYPSDAFQVSFNSLVSKVIKSYEHLDSSFQNKMRALGSKLISEYIDHMRSIVSALESYAVPNFGAISDEFLVYKTATKIPGVDTHQEENLSLRKKVGTLIGICLNRLKKAEEEASQIFLGSDNKLHETIDNLAHLRNLILVSSEHVKLTGVGNRIKELCKG